MDRKDHSSVTVIEVDLPMITLMEHGADTDSTSDTETDTAKTATDHSVPGQVMKSLIFKGAHVWLRELYGTGLEDVVLSTPTSKVDRVKSASLIGSLVQYDHVIECSLKRSTLSTPSQWSLEGVLNALWIMITPQHARILLLLMHQITLYRNSCIRSQSTSSSAQMAAVKAQQRRQRQRQRHQTARTSVSSKASTTIIQPTSSIPSTPSSLNDQWTADMYFSVAERDEEIYYNEAIGDHRPTTTTTTSSSSSSSLSNSLPSVHVDDKEARISQWAFETTNTTRTHTTTTGNVSNKRQISNPNTSRVRGENEEEEDGSIWVDLFQPLASPSSTSDNMLMQQPTLSEPEIMTDVLTSKMILEDLTSMTLEEMDEQANQSRQHPAMQFNHLRTSTKSNATVTSLTTTTPKSTVSESLIGHIQLKLLELNVFLMLEESTITLSFPINTDHTNCDEIGEIQRVHQLASKENHLKWSMEQIDMNWQCFHTLQKNRRSQRMTAIHQSKHNQSGLIPKRTTLDIKLGPTQLLSWFTKVSTDNEDIPVNDQPSAAHSRPSNVNQYEPILTFSTDLLSIYDDINNNSELNRENSNDIDKDSLSKDHVLTCHMTLDGDQDCIIKTQPIQFNLDLKRLEQFKIYFEMVQLYQQQQQRQHQKRLDKNNMHDRMSRVSGNGLNTSFESEYRMNSRRRGQVDSMAQCVFDDLGQPSFSNTSNLPSSLNKDGQLIRKRGTFKWSTALIRVDIGIPDGFKKTTNTMDHLVESLQFDLLQPSLQSGEELGLGEISLNDPSSTSTPMNTRHHHQHHHQSDRINKTNSYSQNSDVDQFRLSCGAIHGFIRDRSCQNKTVHFLSISSTDQLPTLDITLRPKSSIKLSTGPSHVSSPPNVEGTEGVQQIFTVFEGDERVRVQ
ncbi:hypothetical protein BDF19DRAFT_127556 [Syncephalis fuscata]|nr:hypothetical protein BDF19DRAFT_127556 [Syncephalis fuscata]